MNTFTRITGQWNLRRVVTLIVTVVLGGAVSYAANVWIIARHYDGINKVPADAPVTVGPSQDYLLTGAPRYQGMLLWFLISAIGAAILTQLVMLGPRALADKVVSLPERLRKFPAKRGDDWPATVMFSAGAALVVSGLFIPALRGVLGVGILLFLPFGAGRVVVTPVSRFVVAVAMSMSRSIATPKATTGTCLLGAAAGLMAGYLVSSLVVRLGLAVVLIAIAVYSSRTGVPAAGMFLMVAAGAVAVDWMFTETAALADDGGWIECGARSWGDFVACEGSENIINGSRNAIPPGACGAAAGSVCAGKPGSSVPQPVPERPDPDDPSVPQPVPERPDPDDPSVPQPVPEDPPPPAPQLIDEPPSPDRSGDGGPPRMPEWPDPEDGGSGDGGPPRMPEWPDPEDGGSEQGSGQPPSRQQDEWDFNEDGEPDAWDTYGDGRPDTWDKNYDGAPDQWARDTNDDGRPDQLQWDRDGDSNVDEWDTDHDGVPNERDTTGDGRPDVWMSEHTGDGETDVWGKDTTGDGKPDSWRPTERPGEPDNPVSDLDGDGQPGPAAEDRDMDGRPEVWSEDLNADGQRDVWDTNGDSRPDAWDTDSDGRPDFWARDTTGDGQMDWQSHDTDRDGSPDQWTWDSDADGEPDVWGKDTVGDGKPDAWRSSERPSSADERADDE